MAKGKFLETSIFGFRVLDIAHFLGVVVLFSPMFLKLFAYGWKNADYNHGAFILPITLFIIYSMKDQLFAEKVVRLSGTMFFASGFLIYLYAVYNDFLFLQVIAFIWIISALFYQRLTRQSFKLLSFPLAYLFFMIPPPGLLIDAITIPLKSISTYGGYLVLKLIHIPVAVSGTILNIRGDELFVTDACSGFRSITTLMALGALYAYYQPTTNVKKWVIFWSVIPLGVLGNIARIALTGWLTFNFGLKYAEGFFHEFSGIVVFVFTTVGLMVFSHLFKNESAS